MSLAPRTRAYMRALLSLTVLGRRDLSICILLVLLMAIAYLPVLRHDFVNYDDDRYVTKNPVVQRGLTLDGARWAFTTTYQRNWHPLTWLSHMLDCELYGLRPGPHHRTSLLLHLANTLLLFWVLRRMTRAAWQSAFVASLFALHPLNVESVAWIAERKNVLSTSFWMLTLLAYLRYVERPQIRRYCFAVVLFGLGLMAKPMLVTVPFVLVLLDYWPLGRLTTASRREGATDAGWSHLVPSPLGLLREKIPFFALSLASCIVTFLAQHRSGGIVSSEALPVDVRIGNALISYSAYIMKLFWPAGLAVAYPYPTSLPLWNVAGSALLLIAASLTVALLGRRKPHLAVGWLWYLGTLVPVIGLVQVGHQAMADRYAYVPLIGLFIAMTWEASHVLAQSLRRQRMLGLAAGSVVLMLAMVTSLQVRHWTNSVSLWKHVVAVTKDNALAHYNLANALSRGAKHEEAIQHYRQALRINPANNAAHNNLANALHRQGKVEEAIFHYREALRINPANNAARRNLANKLFDQGETEEAISHYERVLGMRPDPVELHYQLGLASLRTAKHEKAIRHYTEALRLEPDFPPALNDLAWIRATHENPHLRDGAQAVQLAERACELTADRYLPMQDTLAAAYAEAGRFHDAVEVARKVIALARASEDERLAAQAESRLESYLAGIPYRERTKPTR